MKYIRTLQNIKKLMDYNRAGMEKDLSEYDWYVTYKDDTYDITIYGEGEENLTAAIIAGDYRARLYYENKNGSLELAGDCELMEIKDVNRLLRETAKEIKAETYKPLGKATVINRVVEIAEAEADERNDERIAAPFRQAKKILFDHFDEIDFIYDTGAYCLFYYEGRNRIYIYHSKFFTHIEFTLEGEKYSVFIDNSSDKVEITGDETVLRRFAPEAADFIETIQKEADRVIECPQHIESKKELNLSLDIFREHIGECSIRNEDNTTWIIYDLPGGGRLSLHARQNMHYIRVGLYHDKEYSELGFDPGYRITGPGREVRDTYRDHFIGDIRLDRLEKARALG